MSRQKLNYNIGSRMLFVRTRAGRWVRVRARGGGLITIENDIGQNVCVGRKRTGGGEGERVVSRKSALVRLSIVRPPWVDHRTRARYPFYRGFERTAVIVTVRECWKPTGTRRAHIRAIYACTYMSLC